jgi:voltage-gated potassium channel Kch
MLMKFLFAWSLMAGCVVIHAVGVTWSVRRFRRLPERSRGLRRWSWILVLVAGWVVLLHLIEITLWSLFYTWQQAMPDLAAALYFSAVTYTTTGYGDLVLPREWRLVGAVEALTGILMCGWSTGFFFAVVSRMLEANAHRRQGNGEPPQGVRR